MGNPNPGPASGSAAWHALIKDRSIQFDFPALPAPRPPPDWLLRLIQFFGHHRELFRIGGWILLAALVLGALYIVARILMKRGWKWREAPAERVLPAWQPSPERARLLLADADALAATGRYDEA